jgi:hypothetical protein
MGLWTYSLSKQKGADAAVVADIKKRTAAVGHAIVEQTRKNPYRVSLLTKDYVWGLEWSGCELRKWNYWWQTYWRRTRRSWKARRTIFTTCWSGIPFHFRG